MNVCLEHSNKCIALFIYAYICRHSMNLNLYSTHSRMLQTPQAKWKKQFQQVVKLMSGTILDETYSQGKPVLGCQTNH